MARENLATLISDYEFVSSVGVQNLSVAITAKVDALDMPHVLFRLLPDNVSVSIQQGDASAAVESDNHPQKPSILL
jgi:hypothetical protein